MRQETEKNNRSKQGRQCHNVFSPLSLLEKLEKANTTITHSCNLLTTQLKLINTIDKR